MLASNWLSQLFSVEEESSNHHRKDDAYQSANHHHHPTNRRPLTTRLCSFTDIDLSFDRHAYEEVWLTSSSSSSVSKKGVDNGDNSSNGAVLKKGVDNEDTSGAFLFASVPDGPSEENGEEVSWFECLDVEQCRHHFSNALFTPPDINYNPPTSTMKTFSTGNQNEEYDSNKNNNVLLGLCNGSLLSNVGPGDNLGGLVAVPPFATAYAGLQQQWGEVSKNMDRGGITAQWKNHKNGAGGGVHPDPPLLSLLGDGRTLTIAEGIKSAACNEDESKNENEAISSKASLSLFDLQLKGCGPTRFSRGLNGTMDIEVARQEFDMSRRCRRDNIQIPSEVALAVVGIGAAAGGRPLQQHNHHNSEQQPHRGGKRERDEDDDESLSQLQHQQQVVRRGRGKRGILVRSLTSSLRVGTLEYLSYTGNIKRLWEVVCYLKHVHFINDIHADSASIELQTQGNNNNHDANKETENANINSTRISSTTASIHRTVTTDVLNSVVIRIAKMVAAWQANGFHHGRMSTDNMTLLGETIDFESSRFLDDMEDDDKVVGEDVNSSSDAICCCYPGGCCWCRDCVVLRIGFNASPTKDYNNNSHHHRADANIQHLFHHHRLHLHVVGASGRNNDENSTLSSSQIGGGADNESTSPNVVTNSDHNDGEDYYPFCIQPIIGYEACLRAADALKPLLLFRTHNHNKNNDQAQAQQLTTASDLANHIYKLYWSTFLKEYEHVMIDVRLQIPRPPLEQQHSEPINEYMPNTTKSSSIPTATATLIPRPQTTLIPRPQTTLIPRPQTTLIPRPQTTLIHSTWELVRYLQQEGNNEARHTSNHHPHVGPKSGGNSSAVSVFFDTLHTHPERLRGLLDDVSTSTLEAYRTWRTHMRAVVQ